MAYKLLVVSSIEKQPLFSFQYFLTGSLHYAALWVTILSENTKVFPVSC